MSSPTPPALQELDRLDRSSSGFHDRLSNVLYGEEYQRCVPTLQGDDLVWLVEYLDKALGCLDPSSPAFRKCLRELRSICGIRQILPASYTISSDLRNIGSDPFASGGFADVYEGTLDGLRVCIKRMRVYTSDDKQTATKIFNQEAVIWKRLTHPNVLLLLGVTINPHQLVSNWMSGGDLRGYIGKNSDADRLGLLSDAAKGLCYLHSCNVIHGDLKGPNILVDDFGHARIADFGVATVTQNLDSIGGASTQHIHSAQWTAPEVLIEGKYSKEGDVFSFAMVMVEAFTGAAPFRNSSYVVAIAAIIQGKRPSQPTHPNFKENLWMLMQRCWDDDPHLRPEVSDALQILLTPEDPVCEPLTNQPINSHPTGGGAGETSTTAQDVQRLADKIRKSCTMILVAKKESSQLMNLCDDLNKLLSDGSLIPQQSNYEDIKSNLVRVEEKLAGWSKYGYAKSFVRRAEIELGITGCIEQLVSAISRCPIAQAGADEEVAPVSRRESQSVEVKEVPPVKRLDGEVVRQGETAFTGGMYCEVWVGRWEKGGGKLDPEKVALKALRTLRSPEGARERLERELPSWAELRHQNLLPFYGVVTDIGPHFYMVSPWQENGNLLAYVKNNPKSNKDYLLRGSAAGLSYLHSRGVVHGSVKCRNVLISHEGEAQICDFGIARVVEEITDDTVSKTVSSSDVVRYSAPELIENNNVSATIYSDTYSFAMLILECITEEVPWSNITRDAAVIHARISKRQCPLRPSGRDPRNRISDGLWKLMTHCWAVKPHDRPTMEPVYSFFLHQA